ncbi:nucleoside phosphorylase domain-containing protein [Aspergillus unguis]
MAFLTLDDYTIAWICALPLEAAAARAMLDRAHPSPRGFLDLNDYTFGELNGHYIVIACLPNDDEDGILSATLVVSRIRLTFPRLQYGLMVGIGGGVPGKNNDIRLGDVVVSNPGHGGLIQYDYGKTVQGGQFVPIGILHKPPPALLARLARVRAEEMITGSNNMLKIVSTVLERYPNMKEIFSPPDEHTDFLFDSSYYHLDKESDCANCDKGRLVTRQPRGTKKPSIHYGIIASGDLVMKDAETRDRLAQEHGILCFETEAAGVCNELPMLVIRGICDYCDTHKQKQWQGFAALTAAAYAKLLLLGMPAYQGDSNSRKSDNTRHWSEDSNPIPERNRQREGTFIAPLTDSGYASTTHQKVLRGEEYRTEYVHDVQSIVSGEEEFSLPPAAASPRNAEGDHNDDTESIYSAGPGISPSDKQSYISELVNDLFRKVQYDQDDQHIPERIHGILPRLLKAFAMRFGQFGSTQIHRDIMVFIRRHRDEIANSLGIKYLEEDQPDSQDSAHDDTKMGLDDLMALWHQNLDADDDIGNPQIDNRAESSIIDEDIPLEDDDEDLPGLTAYRKLITGSPVYEWLLGSFRRELHLHPAEPNAQDAIRHRILDSLPSPRRVSRYDQPRIYQVVFHLNWDPMAFITEQEYDICKEGFLGKIITITGTCQDAQAMTCLQYLYQTWHSCGTNILQLIEATLLDERDYEHRCTLSDNTLRVANTIGTLARGESLRKKKGLARGGASLNTGPPLKILNS